MQPLKQIPSLALDHHSISSCIQSLLATVRFNKKRGERRQSLRRITQNNWVLCWSSPRCATQNRKQRQRHQLGFFRQEKSKNIDDERNSGWDKVSVVSWKLKFKKIKISHSVSTGHSGCSCLLHRNSIIQINKKIILSSDNQ